VEARSCLYGSFNLETALLIWKKVGIVLQSALIVTDYRRVATNSRVFPKTLLVPSFKVTDRAMEAWYHPSIA
jgi:hypothetical protein